MNSFIGERLQEFFDGHAHDQEHSAFGVSAENEG
jgi:hypothetical protein